MAAANSKQSIGFVSFNMHGFNQGKVVIDDLIKSQLPDLFMLQEHWLTPANMHKFEDSFSEYFLIGRSAMTERVESGMLFGRPFGGVAFLVHNRLRSITTTINCDDRYAIVKIASYIFICVYLPCSGTKDRPLLYEEILTDLWMWREQYPECECVIAGDFNTELSCSDEAASIVNQFIDMHKLCRCDELFPGALYK